MRRGPAVALGLLASLLVTGCSPKPEPTPAGEQTPVPQQVELSYTVPGGMSEVPMPAATPEGGVQYDIKLYRGKDSCELRVVRLVLPRGDGQEDQDATYNMLGAIMKASGISQFSTNGVMVPGDPGPIPTLTASGQTSKAALRAVGRLSNESLQGYQLVYGCEKAKLAEGTWTTLVESLKVTGFTGPLTEH
ncbi:MULTISPECIES: hypothetical protein [unclassified Luteococcus]|uniref:hypothetical protein n=1 Tax=unclassified Luteococcus TaxID=2639923 RepID=UPI00313DAEF5